MKWQSKALGELVTLLPARSIALAGDAEVLNATSACLSVFGFLPEGIKRGRMWKKDVAESILYDGEILVARSNTPELVGNVARFRGQPAEVVGSDLIMRLWPNDDVDGEYLCFHLSALYHDGYWRERAGGASGTMKEITRTQLAALPVLHPPLPEQRRIAARLREQLTEVEKTRAALQSQLHAAEKLPQAALRDYFAAEKAKAWPGARLGQCVTLINGRAYSQHELLQRGTPVIRIQNLNGGSRWYYSDLSLPDEKLCVEGELLFAWSASFGPYIWKGPKAIYHYHIWKVVPHEHTDKRFMFYLLQWITESIRAGSHGIAMLHMTKEGMENWPVTLPALDEQRSIAAALDALHAPTQTLLADIRARLDAVEKLPAALLREAFGNDDAQD